MYCHHCAAPVTEGQTFCSQCGTPLNRKAEPFLDKETDPQADQVTQQPQPFAAPPMADVPAQQAPIAQEAPIAPPMPPVPPSAPQAAVPPASQPQVGWNAPPAPPVADPSSPNTPWGTQPTSIGESNQNGNFSYGAPPATPYAAQNANAPYTAPNGGQHQPYTPPQQPYGAPNGPAGYAYGAPPQGNYTPSNRWGERPAPVDFADAVKNYINNYFNFRGRCGRAEFWWTELALILCSVVLGIVSGILTVVAAFADIGFLATLGTILTAGFSIFTFIPSLSMIIRRLHDIGKSGWCYLVCLIPCVGPFILLYWYCQRSE